MRMLMIALLAFFIVGCNTMEGFGKDIKKVGTAIENSADKGK